ncbi:hypothetical protein [Marinisporobacter balticus]|uniref:Phage terminase large subunit-like protein n=1 Tax=Marinisporobacter balticus TaxID=2018667 RepID=A0A4R2KYH8_9FIRM|nr:hypothetical protein [Marinisporobacter balticus]TCO79124.1 hypothetical protein EV214_103176 [Marinisporobacter balticus]
MIFTARQIIEKRKQLWEQNKEIELDRDYRESIAQYLLQKEAAELRREIQAQPELLIEMFFIVVDKEQRTVPFFLNELQWNLLEHIKKAIEDYAARKRNHLKFLLLKGRQGGFTTVITALQLSYAIVRKNFAGYTLADIADNTEAIFTDKAKFVLDNLPEAIKPTEKYNNRRELHFLKENGKGLNSRWRIATAGNKDVGRSKTLNFFHGSESAFWDNLKSILTGLGEALTKDSIQILETTANGYNEYKEMWDDTENTWEKLFYEWWRTQEYELTFEDTQKEKDFKRHVENAVGSDNVENPEWCYQRCKWLLEVKNLSWGQLYWYYNKWKDKKEDIKQEYPCTPEEAFLASGSNYFDIEAVSLRMSEVKDYFKENEPKTGYFEFNYVHEKIVDSSIKWIDDPTGYVKIYQGPEWGHFYVGGGDTAGEGSDWNTAVFTDNYTKEEVASIRIQTDEDLYARQAYCLGRYYNNALLGIETNFSTHPVKELTRLGYKNQYVREESPDKFSGQLTKKFGFNTNKQTRPLALSMLRQEFREHPERFRDLDLLVEMTTFVKNEQGKAEAMIGKHDDMIMARAINCYIAAQQKEVPKFKAKEESEVEKIKNDLVRKINKAKRNSKWR